MKVKVDKEACIGCGMCIDICPKVFEYDDEGKSVCKSEEISDDLSEKVNESADVCPVSAISVD